MNFTIASKAVNGNIIILNKNPNPATALLTIPKMIKAIIPNKI